MVDLRSTRYAIARRYMIRLRRDDFDDPHELARFAATCHLPLAEFRRQFEGLIQLEPPALRLGLAEHRVPAPPPSGVVPAPPPSGVEHAP